MRMTAAIARWTGVGATDNARRSLDEWVRSQDEVSALLARLDDRDTGRPAASGRGSAA